MGLFFEEGGMVMIPTLVFGFLVMVSAVLSLWRSSRRWLTLVLAGLTAASGVLGTSLGLINTMKFAVTSPLEARLAIIAQGTAESLNNLVLAMILVVLSLLISAVAALRHGRAAELEAA